MKINLKDLPIYDYYYYQRGNFNAITDVDGVKVGHATVVEGEDVRTGVTVISPLENYTSEKLVASGYAFNGNGETMGLNYLVEEGRLTSPIFLTNTYSVGDVVNAVIDYYHGAISLPIVGECWDGYLNDIEGRHVKRAHVITAIELAQSGQVEQGSVGAGTGMTSFGFKAGIGTSSRIIPLSGKNYTLGVLVNNNLGTDILHHNYLRIGGVDIGKFYKNLPQPGLETDSSKEQQSSAIIVIGTDIPLLPHQLTRISKRAILGMGRLGVVSYTTSGDFIIAFSTGNKIPRRGTGLPWQSEVLEESQLDNVFEATIEAVEEALINSILCAEEMRGFKGHVMKEFPVEDFIKKGVFPKPIPKSQLIDPV